MFGLIVIILTVIFVAYLLSIINIWRKMPPGPYGLPLLGSAHKISPRRPWDAFATYAKMYGPIYSITMTHGINYIVVSDFEIAADMFGRYEFSSRPGTYVFDFGRGFGIIAADGHTWHENRRFTMRTLRDFGFGKSSLNDFIMEDLHMLINTFSTKMLGKPVDINHQLNLAVLNTIWRMVGNTSFQHDDPDLIRLLEALQAMLDSNKNFSSFFAIALHRPKLIRFLKGSLKSVAVYRQYLATMARNTVKEHKDTRDPGFNRDLVDTYLQQMERTATEKDSSFTETNLFFVIRDMFVAGSETTSTSIRWGLLYLIAHPEIQKRAQKEIDDVVGRDVSVSLDDRGRLPYNEAMIMEIQRLANVLPLGLYHGCSTDVEFCGYLIPKNSTIVVNQRLIHMDPKNWPKPEKFDPTRFLDANGRLKTGKIHGFLPFGIGKRQCMGETLARMELFLFMTNFLQKFNFEKVSGEELPDFNDTFDSAAIQKPPDYKMVITSRR